MENLSTPGLQDESGGRTFHNTGDVVISMRATMRDISVHHRK
jgi:hypothetical protein